MRFNRGERKYPPRKLGVAGKRTSQSTVGLKAVIDLKKTVLRLTKRVSALETWRTDVIEGARKAFPPDNIVKTDGD